MKDTHTQKPITDTRLRQAKPGDGPIQIGDNTYLEILPVSARRKKVRKVWRMRYNKPIDRKPSRYTIGEYPDILLNDARKAAWAAKELVRLGIDPVAHRKAEIQRYKDKQLEQQQLSENTFEKVTRSWHQHRRDVLQKWNEKTAGKVIRSLELHVFEYIGDKPIGEVQAVDMLAIVERMQNNGKTNVVRKVCQRIKAVFDYALMRGLVDSNPAASISSELKPYTVIHNPTLEEEEVRQFFSDLRSSRSSETLQIAVEFTMRTLARTEEVRYAEWGEFDFEQALWTPKPIHRKLNKAHVYPLPTQVLELLKKLKNGYTGQKYLFVTHSRNTPMSENGMLDVLYRMGYKSQLTIHGLRGTGSTILNEAFDSLLVDEEFNKDLIEKALSHGDSDKVRSAYNHSKYINSLRLLLQYYSDYLDAMRDGKDVLLTVEGVVPKTS